VNLDKLTDRLTHALDVLCVLCLAAMVVMVFGNVVLRYAFNDGITVSEELSRWLFIWMTFMGAAVAVKEHGHLGTDMLVGRLGPTGKRLCLIVSYLLMLLINVYLFQGSWAQTVINADVEAPVTGFSMAWVYASGVVFSVLASVLMLRELWRVLTGRLRDDELVAVRESEDVGPGHEGPLGGIK
jgi:TRAP-type transport system small permease protein